MSFGNRAAQGTVMPLAHTFKDAETGLPTDPAAAWLRILDPDEVITSTALAPTPAAGIERESAGVYEYALALLKPGTYRWYWLAHDATGNVTEATGDSVECAFDPLFTATP